MAVLATDHKIVYIAGAFHDGSTTISITSAGTEIKQDLQYHQEEADTRMLCHAMKADLTFADKGIEGDIILKSPDTDVVMLAAHYFHQMVSTAHLWVGTEKLGLTTDHQRYIPIHEICHAISPTLLKILPAVHALTGWDSVPSLYHIGKKIALNVITAYGPEVFASLEDFGKNDLDTYIESGRKFVAALYDSKYQNKQAHEFRV